VAGKSKAKKEDLGLQLTIDAINKEFGEGTLFSVGINGRIIATEKFSSGSPKLNRALGGGYGAGRIIEIIGPESSGKTTLCLHAIREVQEAGGVCAFIDVENALDLEYAQDVGVDVDSLLISQPNNGEQAMQIVDKLIRTGKVKLIIVDSVAALVPKEELEGQVGDTHVGRQARLMSQTLRMITPQAKHTGTTIIFTNQIRMKIGVMFGNPETTPGGEALKYYASQRLDIRKTAVNKDADGEATSNSVKVKVIKNKIAPPFKTAELDIEYGRGLNIFAEILDLGEEYGIVARSGAWYSLEAQRLGQGRGNAILFLEENPEIFTIIEERVKHKMFGDVAQILAEAPPLEEELKESVDD
jgi:recombination protein RecA